MTGQLNRLERLILIGAVADLRQLKRTRSPTWGNSALRRAIQDAREENLVKCDPARWLDERLETAAQRMAVSRAYVSLELRGLIDRVALGCAEKRCSHVRPTSVGVKLAKEFKKGL